MLRLTLAAHAKTTNSAKGVTDLSAAESFLCFASATSRVTPTNPHGAAADSSMRLLKLPRPAHP